MLHASVPLGHLPAWAEARDTLLGAAGAALDLGLVPTPMLLAYEGDEPLATVLLRPFGSGELTNVLVETLALLLPIGADRLALTVPGRAWSTDDPIPPVTPEVDLRRPVVVLTSADAHRGPCQLESSLHPYTFGDEGWSWDDDVALDGLDAPATAALRILLGSRDELSSSPDRLDLRVAAQFTRILLLGHDVLLAPTAANRLGSASMG